MLIVKTAGHIKCVMQLGWHGSCCELHGVAYCFQHCLSQESRPPMELCFVMYDRGQLSFVDKLFSCKLINHNREKKRLIFCPSYPGYILHNTTGTSRSSHCRRIKYRPGKYESFHQNQKLFALFRLCPQYLLIDPDTTG